MFFENEQYCLQYYYYCLQYCLKFINIVSSKQYDIPYFFKNIIFYIINNIVTYVYNIVWALSIFFFKQTILFLYCLYCLLYCMYCLQYCLEKNYVVCIVYNIVDFCVLVQYGFVLFIHLWYLL